MLAATGQDREALALLLRARKLRATVQGESDHRVGEIDRLLGGVQLSLGNDAAAAEAFDAAVRTTGGGLGEAHPRALLARLAQDHYLAVRGDPKALLRLDALARPAKVSGIGARKVAWLAGTYAAGLRCHGSLRQQSLARLQALAAEVRNALPQGSSTAREIRKVRAACE